MLNLIAGIFLLFAVINYFLSSAAKDALEQAKASYDENLRMYASLHVLTKTAFVVSSAVTVALAVYIKGAGLG